MNYATVCSGIEAPSVAWESLNWKAQWFSEIEPFPCAVLKHHYPNVPNLGDMTKINETETFRQSTIDVLCGGTPCQSFSVAGLRKGLADPRGNLMLTFLSLADAKRPKWIVWENVPGVLSSNGGRDFGAFLGGLAECGYGWAYRVLDAQYFGVPQRRRRVFVVGCLGDYRSAGAILFERNSLHGHPAPSRKKGQEVTQIAGTLAANGGGTTRPAGNANELDFCITAPAPITYGIDEECNVTENGFGPLLRGGQGGTRQAVAYDIICNDANGTRKDRPNGGFYVREAEIGTTLTGAKNDTHVLQAVAFEPGLARRKGGHTYEEVSGCLRADPGDNRMAVAFNVYGGNKRKDRPEGGFYVKEEDFSKTLDTSGGLNPACSQGGTGVIQPVVFVNVAPTIGSSGPPYSRSGNERVETEALAVNGMAVRRLTPVECARLQGFPDYYLDIKPNGKPTPDGVQYKALGNSMAVPCLKWIGQRIEQVQGLPTTKPALRHVP